jgi:hypothetical protein
MRNAQYRDSTAERSQPCPRGQAEACTTLPGTAHGQVVRRGPGPLAQPGHACTRSHPMTAPPPQRRNPQGVPPSPRQLGHAGTPHQGRVLRPAFGRPVTRRPHARSSTRPPTHNADVPCLPAKAIHGTPAFRGYHISLGFFTRLSWPRTGRASPVTLLAQRRAARSERDSHPGSGSAVSADSVKSSRPTARWVARPLARRQFERGFIRHACGLGGSHAVVFG